MQYYYSFLGFIGIMLIIGLGISIIWIVIASLIAKDAEKYGESGFLWGLIVFLTGFIGILIYLIVRSSWQRSKYQPPVAYGTPQGYSTTPTPQIIYCSNCGMDNTYGSQFCKNCGDRLH